MAPLHELHGLRRPPTRLYRREAPTFSGQPSDIYFDPDFFGHWARVETVSFVGCLPEAGYPRLVLTLALEKVIIHIPPAVRNPDPEVREGPFPWGAPRRLTSCRTFRRTELRSVLLSHARGGGRRWSGWLPRCRGFKTISALSPTGSTRFPATCESSLLRSSPSRVEAVSSFVYLLTGRCPVSSDSFSPPSSTTDSFNESKKDLQRREQPDQQGSFESHGKCQQAAVSTQGCQRLPRFNFPATTRSRGLTAWSRKGCLPT